MATLSKSKIVEILKNFTNTLRFKLTLLYALILFLFCSGFVLAINVYLNEYLQDDPPMFFSQKMRNDSLILPPWAQIPKLERERIREVRRKDLERIQTISEYSLVPLALLSFGLGYYLVGKSLEPLNMLQKKIIKMKDSDLGTQVEVVGDDEIASLARSFNDMSVRLKRSFDNQTQFVQDASHELRTPLTIIQTNLDTILYDQKAKPEEYRRAIENSLKGMKNINRLTEQLLTLSRPNNLQLKKIDLRKVASEQVQQLNELAKSYGVELKVDLARKPVIKAIDEELFGRAIFNLTENAIKYSQTVKKPIVVVGVSEHEGKAIVSIADNGLGIPTEHQKRIWDRFYRVDKSRSRKSGGFGLGLAIVKRIVEDHGGTVELESRKGRTEFRIVV